MLRWTVELTEAADQELTSLTGDIQARFLHVAGLLEVGGPVNVGMPHVRHLAEKLWEMRLQGRDGIARAMYFAATGRKCTVVRVFVKKTKATPQREIALALQRMSELKR